MTSLPGVFRFGRRQVLTEDLFDDVLEQATLIGLIDAVLRTRHLRGNLVAGDGFALRAKTDRTDARGLRLLSLIERVRPTTALAAAGQISLAADVITRLRASSEGLTSSGSARHHGQCLWAGSTSSFPPSRH